MNPFDIYTCWIWVIPTRPRAKVKRTVATSTCVVRHANSVITAGYTGYVLTLLSWDYHVASIGKTLANSIELRNFDEVSAGATVDHVSCLGRSSSECWNTQSNKNREHYRLQTAFSHIFPPYLFEDGKTIFTAGVFRCQDLSSYGSSMVAQAIRSDAYVRFEACSVRLQ